MRKLRHIVVKLAHTSEMSLGFETENPCLDSMRQPWDHSLIMRPEKFILDVGSLNTKLRVFKIISPKTLDTRENLDF